MTIGERIRDARKAANMNQSELGVKLDIGKSSISEWESGKRPVPIDLVDAIADALNITVPFLMGWCIEEETKDYSAFSLSPAALTLARKYDALDDHGKMVLDSIADLETQRLAVPDRSSPEAHAEARKMVEEALASTAVRQAQEA